MRTKSRPSKKVGFHVFSRKKVVVRPKSRGRKSFETDGCLFISFFLKPSFDPRVYPTDVRGAPSIIGIWVKKGHLFEMNRGCNLDYQKRGTLFFAI